MKPSAAGRGIIGPSDTPSMRMASLLSRSDRARRVTEHRQSLGTADLRLLWLLRDGRGRTMREIAVELRLEQSTIHRQVAAAQRHGYVHRLVPEDGGPMVLAATGLGLQVLATDVETSLSAIDMGLATLDDAEVEQLLSLLSRFVDGYDGAAVDLDGSSVPATATR